MFKSIGRLIGRVGKDERGLTAVEYAVLGGIVVAGIVAISTTFQADLKGAFDDLFKPAATGSTT